MLPKSHFKKRSINKRFNLLRFFKDRKVATVATAFVMCISFFGQDFINEHSEYFQMSLIRPTSVPYQGMGMPIKRVPNWVELTEAERYMVYGDIPTSKFIDIPTYNIRDFKAGKEWQTATDYQRNAYITFPVPHLGNYRLDGSEYSGSHPGIDIKAPTFTPVYASSSGIVVKSSMQPEGFGRHIVIQSDGVPDISNNNEPITIFTTYAHLSEIKVQEGQIVNLGDLVGLVGESGMATAPHLHWQIDRSEAPFHGYWPFMWDDVQKAGLGSYFEAVQQGLKQENGIKYTIHPAELVATADDIQDLNLVASADENNETIINNEPVANEDTNELTNSGTDKLENDDESDLNDELYNSPESEERTTRSWRNAFSMEFKTDATFVPGQEKTVTLLFDNPEKLQSGVIKLSSTLKGLVDLNPAILTSRDIQTGQVEIKVVTDSHQNFRLIATSSFGEEKSNLLKAQVFSDVPSEHPYQESIAFLKGKGTVQGYGDGTFGLFKNLNRAEAVKIILDSNDIKPHHIPSLTLSDVPTQTWFAGWISSAVDSSIVNGYPDGTFRPGSTMTRAEFFKVAILTAGFTEARETLVASGGFKDVPDDTWFTGFMAFAKQHALLPPTNKDFIEPGKPITRGEAAHVIHKLWELKH